MNALVILAIAVLGASATVLFLIGYRQMRTDAMGHLAVEDLDLLKGRERRRAEGEGPVQKLARRLVPTLRRALGPQRLEELRRRIDEAGRPDGLTVQGFLERTAMWCLIVVPLSLVLAVQGQLLVALLALAIPVVIPLGSLSSAQGKRRQQIDRDLPDFLDVLAVTVMAGVNFRAALARVAERIEGPLADEVMLTLSQISNGASVRQAFTDLRRRSSSEPVAQFVSTLLQSQELGAPLAESLNQIAADLRRDSAQRQRQAAAKLAPRVTLVTSLVLVPGALIFVLVGMVIGMDIDFDALGSL